MACASRVRHFVLLTTVLVVFASGARAAPAADDSNDQFEFSPQMRDAVPPPQRVGTGVIRGQVVDGASGKPVPRARVRLNGGSQRPSLLTDDRGTFAFSALPAGTYSVTVDKSTYNSSGVPDMLGRTYRSAS